MASRLANVSSCIPTTACLHQRIVYLSVCFTSGCANVSDAPSTKSFYSFYYPAATTAARTSTIATVTDASQSICPKCGTKKSGKPSCCAPDGAWFKNCGTDGDTQFDHTWLEGEQACERKLMHRPPHVRWCELCIYPFVSLFAVPTSQMHPRQKLIPLRLQQPLRGRQRLPPLLMFRKASVPSVVRSSNLANQAAALLAVLGSRNVELTATHDLITRG